ncbi:MAG: CHAP domain-containing protein [Hyphomicrobiaceae bacterium]|nr:CHAP domain-containing protein [Hyphomicrobiaceae bacterium]
MKYPGKVIVMGETDGGIVVAIADRLTKLGYHPPNPPVFNANMKGEVKLFQSQHFDALGRPLRSDGEIGPLTWTALFDDKPAAAVTTGGSAYAMEALKVAVGEIGKMEVPIGSNSGPDVNKYLKSTGLGGGYYWCMAFVHWCYMTAAANLGVAHTFPKTAGCIDAWNRSKGHRITRAEAIANPTLVTPGAVFILDHGGGAGHTGIVESNSDGALVTIEGNSNPNGSRNGIGVFRLSRRNVMDSSLKGFIIL